MDGYGACLYSFLAENIPEKELKQVLKILYGNELK